MSCPLCSPSDHGFRITFRDASERAGVSTALEGNRASFKALDDITLFVDGQHFFRFYDYWTQFYDTRQWIVQSSIPTTLVNGLFGEPVEWSQIIHMKPSVWVREVIQNDRIRMMAQPIVHLDQHDGFAGYEMLARGFDESGHTIPPNQLFTAAKDQEQLFLLDKTCRIKGIETAGHLPGSPAVFINFIPTAIYVPEHCLQSTLAAVERCGLSPHQIVFEVVETERVADLSHLKRILDYYRQRGFRYALDDVGAGHNNLEMLNQLEPDFVKLDRAFVDGVHLHPERRAVAQNVLEAAHRVGATALAEGIEHQEEADVLGEIGYRWQQGYFYGRPAFV